MPRAAKITQTTAPTLRTPSLPKGWRMVRFGDVVNNVNETVSNPLKEGLERFVGLEHLEPRDLRIRSWGNIADGTTFNRRFRAGQVLFGKRRAYQRKAALADFPGICSGDIYVFSAQEPHLVPELLPFLVQSEGFAKNAEDTSEGSLSPRTKWKYLAAYEFALPSDPNEQRRIAELLAAADEAAEGWQDTRQALVKSRESRLDHWFDPARATPPSSWRMARLDEVASLQTGLALGKDYDAVETERRPYLRVANVQDGHFDLSLVKEVTIPKSDIRRYLLQAGDVLMRADS